MVMKDKAKEKEKAKKEEAPKKVTKEDTPTEKPSNRAARLEKKAHEKREKMAKKKEEEKLDDVEVSQDHIDKAKQRISEILADPLNAIPKEHDEVILTMQKQHEIVEDVVVQFEATKSLETEAQLSALKDLFSKIDKLLKDWKDVSLPLDSSEPSSLPLWVPRKKLQELLVRTFQRVISLSETTGMELKEDQQGSNEGLKTHEQKNEDLKRTTINAIERSTTQLILMIELLQKILTHFKPTHPSVLKDAVSLGVMPVLDEAIMAMILQLLRWSSICCNPSTSRQLLQILHSRYYSWMEPPEDLYTLTKDNIGKNPPPPAASPPPPSTRERNVWKNVWQQAILLCITSCRWQPEAARWFWHTIVHPHPQFLAQELIEESGKILERAEKDSQWIEPSAASYSAYLLCLLRFITKEQKTSNDPKAQPFTLKDLHVETFHITKTIGLRKFNFSLAKILTIMVKDDHAGNWPIDVSLRRLLNLIQHQGLKVDQETKELLFTALISSKRLREAQELLETGSAPTNVFSISNSTREPLLPFDTDPTQVNLPPPGETIPFDVISLLKIQPSDSLLIMFASQCLRQSEPDRALRLYDKLVQAEYDFKDDRFFDLLSLNVLASKNLKMYHKRVDGSISKTFMQIVDDMKAYKLKPSETVICCFMASLIDEGRISESLEIIDRITADSVGALPPSSSSSSSSSSQGETGKSSNTFGEIQFEAVTESQELLLKAITAFSVIGDPARVRVLIQYGEATGFPSNNATNSLLERAIQQQKIVEFTLPSP